MKIRIKEVRYIIAVRKPGKPVRYIATPAFEDQMDLDRDPPCDITQEELLESAMDDVSRDFWLARHVLKWIGHPWLKRNMRIAGTKAVDIRYATVERWACHYLITNRPPERVGRFQRRYTMDALVYDGCLVNYYSDSTQNLSVALVPWASMLPPIQDLERSGDGYPSREELLEEREAVLGAKRIEFIELGHRKVVREQNSDGSPLVDPKLLSVESLTIVTWLEKLDLNKTEARSLPLGEPDPMMEKLLTVDRDLWFVTFGKKVLDPAGGSETTTIREAICDTARWSLRTKREADRAARRFPEIIATPRALRIDEHLRENEDHYDWERRRT